MPEAKLRELEKEGVQILHRMKQLQCIGKSNFYGGVLREEKLKVELLLGV